MKRFLILALLALFVMVGTAEAARILKVTEIMDETFNAVTTDADSTATYIQGYDKVAFLVDYAETEVGLSISAAITIDISFDGTTYLDANFYDYAGGATLQTTETISSDGSFYFWFDKDICVPYVRVNVVATNTDADDLLDVEVYIVGRE